MVYLKIIFFHEFANSDTINNVLFMYSLFKQNNTMLCPFVYLQLSTEWTQLEVIDLINDGSGLGFGIIGGKSTGVVVKTILPGGVADRVSNSYTAVLRLRQK